MIHFAIIGIGAGAAAALLFASVTSGTLLSIPLFYLAPLPIMIAGLGWGQWVALTATLTGAFAIGIIFGTVFLFAFLAVAGVPAWWLSYLAMLARPAAASTGNGRADVGLRMVPTGTPGGVGRGSRRLVCDCRHSEFWHRRRNFSRGHAELA